MKTICILGLGYIGLPTAAMFATHGKKVIGVDINQKIVNTLNDGDIHIHEPGLRELVHQALSSGNLKVSIQAQPADVFIIAVPTPFQQEIAQTEDGIKYKKADMRYVVSATEAILPHLRPGNLVILESTSPPRTTVDLVKPILERSGLKAGEDFYLAYSPERVLPGNILYELVHNARVIGGVNQASAEKGLELCQSFVEGEILFTDSTTAEMVKLMENTYRDVNIALANEFSRLAEWIGFDEWEAIELANHHPRVNILRPGPGVGGHCISVDPWFLVESAPEATPLIRQARKVNDSQPEYVVKLIEKALGGLVKGKRIAALGLAYKPDIDDLRESPAVEVVKLLEHKGAHIKAYEPFNPDRKFETFKTTPSLEDAVFDADVIVLLVGHDQFKSIEPEIMANITSSRTVVDIINGWNKEEWEAAGFLFFALGDRSIPVRLM